MMAPTPSGTLPNLEAFCRTFETGSFTKAAHALGVTPQATSRSVARLEGVLGVTLFRRTTRSLAPTDAARRYYDLCSRALTMLADGERELETSDGEPEGLVRISAPTTYGHHLLLPSLGGFAARYPKVRVDIGVSNQNIDFTRDGFDLAIRRGPISDRTLVARKLGDFGFGIYASSSYIARHDAPKKPEDLDQHACVTFVMPSSGKVLPWTFGGGARSFVPEARYRCTDDVLGIVALARAGLGLIQVFDFLVAEDIANGRLVEVLAAYRGPSRSFALVYPKAVKPRPAVRAMIDFILSQPRRTI